MSVHSLFTGKLCLLLMGKLAPSDLPDSSPIESNSCFQVVWKTRLECYKWKCIYAGIRPKVYIWRLLLAQQLSKRHHSGPEGVRKRTYHSHARTADKISASNISPSLRTVLINLLKNPSTWACFRLPRSDSWPWIPFECPPKNWFLLAMIFSYSNCSLKFWAQDHIFEFWLRKMNDWAKRQKQWGGEMWMFRVRVRAS